MWSIGAAAAEANRIWNFSLKDVILDVAWHFLSKYVKCKVFCHHVLVNAASASLGCYVGNVGCLTLYGVFAAGAASIAAYLLAVFIGRGQWIKMSCLVAATFFEGADIGPWISWIVFVRPFLVESTLLGAALQCASVWASIGFVESALLGAALQCASVWASIQWENLHIPAFYFCLVSVLVWTPAATHVMGGDSVYWVILSFLANIWCMQYVLAYHADLDESKDWSMFEPSQLVLDFYIRGPRSIGNVLLRRLFEYLAWEALRRTRRRLLEKVRGRNTSSEQEETAV